MQSLNIYVPKELTEFGIVTFSNSVHLEKAKLSIVFIVSGNTISLTPLHSAKALLSIQ